MSVYADDELAHEVRLRADREDISVSEYIESVLETHVAEDETLRKTRELQAEQRVLNLVSEAHDQITEDTDAMREMQAKTGVYAVAAWELIKRDHSDVARQNALSIGAERLRDDLEQLGTNVDEIQNGLDTEPESHTNTNTNTNENETTGDSEGWEF